MSRLVTIATFNHSSQYAVLQSHLSSQGIETVVTNATSGDILSIYGIGTSPIQLKVREEDLGRAREIMRSHGFVENLGRQHAVVTNVNKLAAHLPIVKDLSPGKRFLLTATLIIAILVVILYFTLLSE